MLDTVCLGASTCGGCDPSCPAAQENVESARHAPQHTHGAEAEATLPPRCLITGCFDDADPTGVFCAWHNFGR